MYAHPGGVYELYVIFTQCSDHNYGQTGHDHTVYGNCLHAKVLVGESHTSTHNTLTAQVKPACTYVIVFTLAKIIESFLCPEVK